MRIGSFTRHGRATYGAFTPQGVIDLGARLGDRYPDLLALIQQGGLEEAAEAIRGTSPDAAPSDVKFLPLVTRPTNIYCAGRNYRDHVAEMAAGAVPPEHPTLFIKTLGALVGHEEAIVKPKASQQFDYEAELAVVLGRGGRHIARGEAMDHVAGYTCLMDGSVRDFQRRATDQGKNFWRSSSIGPWLATPDEVPPRGDWDSWKIRGKLNGQVMQSSNIGALIHGVEDLITYYSGIAELLPGDIISTGTCAGVGHGRKPPVYLKPGDVFETEIEGVGVLRNPVVGE